MKKRVNWVIMQKCLLVVLALGFFLSCQAQSGETLVKVGQQAPEFSVNMFDGSVVSLKDLKGKVVLLNFWATWCPPCRLELNRVQKDIIDRFAGEDFVFLPVSRQDSYEKIKTFREQTGHQFPMGMDTDRKIYALFATATIPRNFLIDRTGKIILAEEGYSDESFQHLIEAIEKALK